MCLKTSKLFIVFLLHKILKFVYITYLVNNIYLFLLFQYMRNSCGAKRALPFSSNPQDGAMGEAGIHSHPAEAAHNEASTVSPR